MSLTVAHVTMHTSPLERPGTADAGGMNVLVSALARAQGELGATVELITRRSSPDQPDRSEVAPGIWVNHLPAGPPTPLPKSQMDQHLAEFTHHLRQFRPVDLFHSHHWFSGIAALPVAGERGLPHVMTYHSVAAHPNSPLRDGEPAETLSRLDGEIRCAESSDLVIAVSHAEAAVVIGRCNADPHRVEIVQPGVDIDLFHPAEPPESWSPAPNIHPGYVLFAARLQPLKGPDVAIGALAEVPAAERPDLVIAGQASQDFRAYAAELHRLVADLGLQDNVHFLPGQDRESLAVLLRHASVLLVPSHSETFGLIALEGAASGIPVLAAAAGGLTEVICNDGCGRLVCSHDPKAWGRELAGLLRDPERRRAYGKAGRERATTKTWHVSAQKTLEHYQRLLEK